VYALGVFGGDSSKSIAHSTLTPSIWLLSNVLIGQEHSPRVPCINPLPDRLKPAEKDDDEQASERERDSAYERI
jgi:hypothetical protein